MVEGIPPQEKFGDVSMAQSEPLVHVQPEHKTCAYYVKLGETFDLNEVNPLHQQGAVTPFIDMECPHGVSGSGGWYSEDYTRELQIAVQTFMNIFKQLKFRKAEPQLIDIVAVATRDTVKAHGETEWYFVGPMAGGLMREIMEFIKILEPLVK